MHKRTRVIISRRVRILLVGANTSRRVALGQLMRRAGAEVVTARSHDEALRYLLSQRFWALVTDAVGGDGESALFYHWDKLPATHQPSRIIPVSIEHGVWTQSDHFADVLPSDVSVDALLGALAGRMN